MSIFGSIMSKIFHHDAAAATPAQPSASAASADGSSASASSTATSAPSASATSAGATAQVARNDNAPSGSAGQTVDVAALLDGLAAKNSQTLDWKHSIVDMLKLLSLDSSLSSRQELAKELGYSGNEQDSATMNVWLHKQVMQKLAANGGIVPDSLKA